MDRALWFLMALRLRGWLRRAGRTLRTVKGAVLVLVALLVFVPWLISIAWLTQPAGPQDLAAVRRFGPLGLFAYCLLIAGSSAGERAISFTPAELNFLFSGPFTRRQLLSFKIVTNIGITLLVALFLAVVVHGRAGSMAAAYVGLVLVLLFLQFFGMVVALLAGTVGARAYNRRRKLVLGALVVLALVLLLSVGEDALRLSPRALLGRIEQSGVLQAVLTPLRWFAEVFTAERPWPDLAKWSALGLAVDAALLALVVGLDAQYLETAAAASERIYARLERVRRGGLAAATLRGPGKAGFTLPSLPWWGGIGPIAWRQVMTVPRTIGWITWLVLVLACVLGPLLFSMRGSQVEPSLVPILVGIIVWLTIFMSSMVTFDFRGDFDRMDVLKSLPIAPWRLVVGQLVAPVLVVSVIQVVGLGFIAAAVGGAAAPIEAAAAFVLPMNFLLFGIDNLLFLWFPARVISSTAADFQAMGRRMLILLAKTLTLLVAGAAAALVGVITYFLAGHRWMAALAAAWLVLAGFAAGLVPLLTLAFVQFDVARDTPP